MSKRRFEKPVVVITAPFGWGDVATDTAAPYYANLYPKYVIDQSKYDVVVLAGQDANTEKFKQVLQQYKGRIIMLDGVGHGGPPHPPQMLTGWKLQPLLKQPTEPHILDGAVLKHISCEIGMYLVPELANQNDNFLGIAEIQDYWIVVEFDYMHKGTDWGEDAHLESFLRVEFETAKMLLNGVKGKEAYEKMLQLYEEEAKKWDNVDPETAQWLRWDAQYRRMFGNPDWQSQPPQQPPQPPQCMPECPWCHAKFDQLDQLKQHILDAHQKDICQPCPPCPECKYKCPWCDKEFDTADQLKQHIFSEHLKPCKLSFVLRKKLNCPLP
ncbi:MAG: C2H2-type zinc finger protein [Conexivisphaerales archaeon]